MPAIDVSPASLDFGSVNTGESKDLTLTIRNTGKADLQVKSITPSSPIFDVYWPAESFKLPPGGQQEIMVEYAPESAGAESATVTIVSNDPARPSVIVKLSGTGVAPVVSGPAIELSPTSLVFFSVPVGSSKTLQIKVRNTGTQNLVVSSVTITNPQFSTVPPLGGFTMRLSPGGEWPITVEFRPTATGVQTAALKVVSNDPKHPSAEATLAGSGT